MRRSDRKEILPCFDQNLFGLDAKTLRMIDAKKSNKTNAVNLNRFLLYLKSSFDFFKKKYAY